MNKVYGTIETYIPYRQDVSRHVISYEMTPLEDNVHATWYEVYIYKKQKPSITFEELKDAVLGDINARTDEKILNGFVWNGNPVWLSAENQRNFSEGQRMAQKDPSILPITYKIGEREDHEPVYHTFTTFEELDGFYKQAFAYINQCLNDGWSEKDSIDWNDYSVFFPVMTE